MPGMSLAFARKDVDIPRDAPVSLHLQVHADYIHSYEDKKESFEYVIMEYLRMSGVYWCVTAMDLMGQLHRMSREAILSFVQSCRREEGGYAATNTHDGHLLHTLSAIQIMATLDALHLVDRDGVARYISALQQVDGSFVGDAWGEGDTRFSLCAVACLALIDRLSSIDVDKACEHIVACGNFDGGFGTRPGSESHAGQVFVCIGTLSICNRLHLVDVDRVAQWLCRRQLPSGGLNGRPEKLPDVCYSWWVLSSLSVLGRLHWIDAPSLTTFIMASQDVDDGGFADRPGDMADPFHTVFGLAGLSLLARGGGDNDVLKEVHPVFCMAVDVVKRCPAAARAQLL